MSRRARLPATLCVSFTSYLLYFLSHNSFPLAKNLLSLFQR